MGNQFVFFHSILTGSKGAFLSELSVFHLAEQRHHGYRRYSSVAALGIFVFGAAIGIVVYDEINAQKTNIDFRDKDSSK